MEKKNIDWENLGFGYIQTDKRYVSNYKDGKWDEGALVDDANITMNECAGVLQYAQTVFEGMKAYTTEDGRIVTFRPDLNAARMVDSAKRLEMPVFPEDSRIFLFEFLAFLFNIDLFLEVVDFGALPVDVCQECCDEYYQHGADNKPDN